MIVPASKYLWRIVPISAALIFAYATVLAKLGTDWWIDENYSHGLLVPFIIGFILWSQRERFAAVAARPSMFWGLTGVVAALLALWAGTAGAELFMQRISLVLMLAGIAMYFWGFQLLRVADSAAVSCCCWRFRSRQSSSTRLRFLCSFLLLAARSGP